MNDLRPGLRRCGGSAGRTLRRVGVAVTGGAVIVAGIAALFLPAPGVLTIFIGLAILATEFAWAGRLRHRARARVARVVRLLRLRAA